MKLQITSLMVCLLACLVIQTEGKPLIIKKILKGIGALKSAGLKEEDSGHYHQGAVVHAPVLYAYPISQSYGYAAQSDQSKDDGLISTVGNGIKKLLNYIGDDEEDDQSTQYAEPRAYQSQSHSPGGYSSFSSSVRRSPIYRSEPFEVPDHLTHPKSTSYHQSTGSVVHNTHKQFDPSAYQASPAFHHGPSIDQGHSFDQGPSLEQGHSLSQGQSFDQSHSLDHDYSVDQGHISEHGYTTDQENSFDHGDSYDYVHSFEQEQSVDHGQSFDQGLSFAQEQDSSYDTLTPFDPTNSYGATAFDSFQDYDEQLSFGQAAGDYSSPISESEGNFSRFVPVGSQSYSDSSSLEKITENRFNELSGQSSSHFTNHGDSSPVIPIRSTYPILNNPSHSSYIPI